MAVWPTIYLAVGLLHVLFGLFSGRVKMTVLVALWLFLAWPGVWAYFVVFHVEQFVIGFREGREARRCRK